MMRFEWELDRLGGVASTAELRALGVGRNEIDVGRMYGKVIRVRKALWAQADVDPSVIRALRLGGRLACVSALRFHGVDVPRGDRLHIEILATASGSKAAAAARSGVVRHWARYPRGHRIAVDIATAWEQFDRCAAAHAPAR